MYMLKTSVFLFSVFISTAIFAQSGTDLNPVGIYEFNSVSNGTPILVKFRIKGEPGNYTGELKASHIPKEMKFTDVATDRNKMILVVDMPNTAFVLRIVFDGDNFKGNWVVGKNGGELEGKKISDSYEIQK